MTWNFREAKRENGKLLIGLAGASSSGKTFSALKLARGLAGAEKFVVLDTEARRALHYADHCAPWDHAVIAPPFTPARYTEAVQAAAAAGYGVIVIDSVSHEHAGEGGLLEMHEAELTRMAGEDYGKRDRMSQSAWVKPKAENRKFMNRLLQIEAHLVLCFRAEDKSELAKNPQTGKMEYQPKKLLSGHEGWIPICEKNTLFELTISLLLTPDAKGYPKHIKIEEDLEPFVPLDRQLSEETGRLLAAWSAGSSPGVSPASGEHLSDDGIEEVVRLCARLLAHGDEKGTRATTQDAINANATANTPVAHLAWLRAQVKRVDKVAA